MNARYQSSGAVWKSRWPPWAPVPNSPYGLCGREATLNLNMRHYLVTRVCSEITMQQPFPLLLCFTFWANHGGHSSGFSRWTWYATFWLAEAARVIGSPESFVTPTRRIKVPRLSASPTVAISWYWSLENYPLQVEKENIVQVVKVNTAVPVAASGPRWSLATYVQFSLSTPPVSLSSLRGDSMQSPKTRSDFRLSSLNLWLNRLEQPDL